ncbi:hypothetical protein K8R03_02915 [Candidatus Kaiserbacteria bacterium]|nr:hypothetical protein [Candidatus Kaiserbacteria bacterium]
MVRAHSLIATSWILALATVIALWWFISADTVNGLFETGEAVGAVSGRGLANLFGMDPAIGEILATDRMHAGRTLAIGSFMLLWLALLTYLNCVPVLRTVGNTLVSIFIVHLILGLLWIGFTSPMSWWYGLHTFVLKSVFRGFGLHKTETFFLVIFQAQSLIIFAEVLFLWRTFVTNRFGRPAH